MQGEIVMTDDANDPVGVLQAMLKGDEDVSPRVVESRGHAVALVAALREDELAILRHIVAGWSKVESAAELGLDLHQFEKRRAGLFAALNATSTTDAVRVGMYAGLD